MTNKKTARRAMLRKKEKAIRRAKRLEAGLTIIHHHDPDTPVAAAPKKPLVPSQIIIPGLRKTAADHQEWSLQYHPRNYTEEGHYLYHPEHHLSSPPEKQDHHSQPPKIPSDTPALATPKKSLVPSKIVIPGLRKTAADHQEWSLQYHPRNHAEEGHYLYHPEHHLSSSPVKQEYQFQPPKILHHRSSPSPTNGLPLLPDSLPSKISQHPEQHRSSSSPTKNHLSEDPKPVIKVDKCGTDDRIKEPLASGMKRTLQPSDEDAEPSAKRLHQSSGQDSAGSSSLRVKKESLPRNPDIFHDVHKWIEHVEQEEYRRRKKMVEDLVKHCKAIPLTVKMSNPLINFIAFPNINESMTQQKSF